MTDEVAIPANDVLERVLTRTAQENAAKVREIATLETYLAALTKENEQLKQALDEKR